jgi:sortase A
MKLLSWLRRHRRYFPVFLMCVGVGLLLYVGIEYARMHFEQRSLAHQWAEQQSSSAQPTAGLTRLTIPKINFEAIVVEGTTTRDLLLGPGHITSTAEPGENGNAVITAHRDTFFRHIYELNRGDVILVKRNGHAYRYEVTGKKVVDPRDISVTNPSADKQLTLITCYPTYFIGPAPKRLVVFSKMQNSGATLAQTSSTGHTTK